MMEEITSEEQLLDEMMKEREMRMLKGVKAGEQEKLLKKINSNQEMLDASISRRIQYQAAKREGLKEMTWLSHDLSSKIFEVTI